VKLLLDYRGDLPIATPEQIETVRREFEGACEMVPKANAAGVRLLTGDDYGVLMLPHGSYAKELEFYVKDLGVPPLDVLRWATRHGAEAMGRGDELGRIAPGRLADLIVVAGDPSSDIAVLQDAAAYAVMRGGVRGRSTRGVAGTVSGDRPATTYPLLLLCFFLPARGADLRDSRTREFAFVFGNWSPRSRPARRYMAGLACGAAVAARTAARIARPVLEYGLLELGIAVAALAVPLGLDAARALYAALWGGERALPDAGGATTALFYLACSFAVLLPPTAMMGATLPLLARHAVREDGQIGARVGLLYAVNTAGAIAGTLLAAFAAPAIGLRHGDRGGRRNASCSRPGAAGAQRAETSEGHDGGARQRIHLWSPAGCSSPASHRSPRGALDAARPSGRQRRASRSRRLAAFSAALGAMLAPATNSARAARARVAARHRRARSAFAAPTLPGLASGRARLRRVLRRDALPAAPASDGVSVRGAWVSAAPPGRRRQRVYAWNTTGSIA
jgi:hypothetical protein